jgi:tetrahydromethanopterin S-methyltransferase subunit F
MTHSIVSGAIVASIDSPATVENVEYRVGMVPRDETLLTHQLVAS